MRSRSSSLEDVLEAEPGRRMEARKKSAERRGRHREPLGDTGTVQRNHRNGTGSAGSPAKAGGREKGRDLSRDDLIFLLSLLEGELQARDEVITVLKADKLDVALLEAKYGFVTPQNVLQALQRDAVQGRADAFQEDIYQKPMEELDKLVEKQRETQGRMLQQLLLAERAHQRALLRLEDEKRNHGDFVRKSDEFTNLLEQERERLKLLVDQERSHQEQKERENRREVAALKEELTKLKSFALMLVEEQQTAGAQEAGTRQAREELSLAREELSSVRERLREEQQKVVHLEAELRHQSTQHRQEQDAAAAKLSGEEVQNQQLRRRLEELEESQENLQRTEEELRDKIGRGQGEELEELRRKVLEMEGKDGELLRTEERCRDLEERLEKEAGRSRSLRVEVDSLNHRILDLEKLEDAFGRSRQECGSLRSHLEKERTASKVLSGELEVLKVRLRELDASEIQLGKTELLLKEDLSKLRTLTVLLAEERKAMAERRKQTEKNVHSSGGKLQEEQEKVASEERGKAELEEKMRRVLEEKEDLKAKLAEEEEKNGHLESQISTMKKRMEKTEGEHLRIKEEHIKAQCYHQEDNKVQDLTQEVERLRRKLKEVKAAEGDLRKAQELESLESPGNRFGSQQEKEEKKEDNQELLLYKRLKEEEAKSGHLGREVQALKEKVHRFTSAEESASLQRKLAQQELRNRELSREMESLSRELERYRRFSRSLRPGMSGRRLSDLHLSTKEVQTEPAEVLERAAVNGRFGEEGQAAASGHGCSSPLLTDAKSLSDPRLAPVPFPRTVDSAHQSHCKNGEVVSSQSRGRPLHIKVTPNRGGSAPSFTSTAVIATGGGPPKQRITIIQNAASSLKSAAASVRAEAPSPNRARSPLAAAAYARAPTPDSCGSASSDGAASPTQVVSVRTGTADCGLPPAEVAAVFHVSPDRPGWQVQRSHGAGPQVITTEDNRIHIHLGAP
uniref:Filamin A interacting protein 1 like n=1 Tax=Tetraodon nigroviridis TaxID=99883 RepID=H3CY34_TETNG